MKKSLIVVLMAITFVLTACTPKEFTVSFDSDGGSNVSDQVVAKGDKATEPSDPSKIGFTFEYWYADDSTTAFDFNTEITKDITLTASWYELETYTVTFDSMGGDSVSSQSITEGDLITEPDLIAKDGYNFVYWYTDDETVAFDFNTVIDADLTLTAYWVEKEVFAVVFDSLGGTEVDSQAIIEGGSATEPTDPELFGHIFLYWYSTDENTAYGFDSPVYDNTTLYAKWEEKTQYVITFDAGIGSSVDSISVYEGEYLTLPTDPTEATHDFLYWYETDENTPYDASGAITANVTLTAKWAEKAVFTVTFDANGGSAVAAENVMDGYLATEPTDPELYAYSFVYWYADDSSTAFDFNTPITGDITLTALWSLKPIYTVTFNSDGGNTIGSQNIIEGELATEPTDPVKYAYTFDYWYLDDANTAFDFNTPITSDITLTALWTLKPVYTVSFDTGSGSAIDPQSVIEGRYATNPSTPTLEGYRFLYWYLDDENTAFTFTNTPITSDVTLTAKWGLLYTLSFDSGDGSAVASQDLLIDEVTTEPADPTLAGYRFVGWYLTDPGTLFEFGGTISEATTLTALWQKVYSVTFESFEDTYEVIVVDEGEMVTEPTEPTLLEYYFDYWYLDDEFTPFDFNTAIMTDITLTAKWTLKPVYTVTFDSGLGSVVDDQSVIENEVAIAPTAPTLDGYRFLYWYTVDENVAYDFATPVVGDVALTAKWGELFTLSFDSDGGSAVSSQVLLGTEATVQPSNPSKVGYRFVGWYESDPETLFEFGGTISADTTLTAYWIKTYTVRFYSFGVVYATYTVDEGSPVPVPTEPTKYSYVFKYWYLTDKEVAYDLNTPVTMSMNLFARWESPTERLIMADMDAYQLVIDGMTDSVPTPATGSVNGSTLKFYSESNFITDDGIVLPLSKSLPAGTTGDWKVKFTLNGESYYRTYSVPLYHAPDVVISESRSVPFTNLTTEYDVADGNLTLYYEQDGAVPYVKLDDFFNLLDGFIDPTIPMTFTMDTDELEIFYQYYDEDEDYTYDLILTVNATENTIVTNDPGFYWAYIYSTETNYGRHITYVQDSPMASSIEGSDVVYDLDDYNMDIVVYEGVVMMPYYMANQLFAGSAYYNVYYNYDALYGIYSLPDDNSQEMRAMMQSTKNGQDIPMDLLIHTFDMMAFDLDNLYGLKDIMDVDTYYDLLYSYRNDLITTDPADFENAIRDVLLQGIDEPHTSYGYFSYFNEVGYDGPVTNSLSVYGPRFVTWYYDGLIDTDDAIGAKWGEASSGWNVTNRPDYWWLDDTVVMLSLDGFVTSDIEESTTYDGTIPQDMMGATDITSILPSIAEGNKFFYYNNSDDDNGVVDILVKGTTSTYVDTYKSALVALGYTLVQETTTDDSKVDGYYTKTISNGVDDGDYMVIVHYDTEFDLLHVGVTNEVPTLYTYKWNVSNEVRPLIDADSAVYMEFMLQEIEEEHPGFTDIILDISWNTGGNVGALYRVLGFITDQPFMVSGMDGDTGGASTYVVDIDNGIPDYSYLNWYLLTTPTSFSAANSLANIFKANELGTVIGVQTGGGACSITPILLPNGTAFTMSSNNISAYRTGSGTEEDPYVYHDVEFGITPDIELEIYNIFNSTILLDIINGVE